MKMIRLTTIAATLLGLALPAHAPAQGFEGTVKQRVTTVTTQGLYEILYSDEDLEGEPDFSPEAVFGIPMESIGALSGDGLVEVTYITFSIRGNAMRMDGGGADEMGYVLIDFDEGTLRILQPQRKMYIEITAEDMKKLQRTIGMMGKDEKTEERPAAEVRPLGVTKEINGMQSVAYEIVSEGETAHVWVAAELKDLVDLFAEFVERMDAMGMRDEEDEEDVEYFELVKEYGFPVLEQALRREGYTGTEYEISEITSVDRQTPPAELFVIPSDWEKRSIMDAFGGMGGNDR